jgi:hypothetical protein
MSNYTSRKINVYLHDTPATIDLPFAEIGVWYNKGDRVRVLADWVEGDL